jgi:hypothetical protein
MAISRTGKALKWVGTIKEGYGQLVGKNLGRALNKRAVGAVEGSYKKGGMVKTRGKKSAIVRVHAGEAVLSKSAVKTLKKMLK